MTAAGHAMGVWRILRLMFLSLAIEMRSSLVESVVYPSIQWSPRNPIFKENGTVRFVLPMSKINIVCPNPSMVVALSQYPTPKAWLFENLWIVSKKAYEACDTSVDQGSRLLLKCMSPLYLAYYTLVFQRYSASENGLEFKRDKQYYFIATSTGTRNSLNSTAGGNCRRNNMRLRFHVCRDDQDPRCAHNPPTNQRPSTIGSKTPLATTQDTTTARAVTSLLPTSRTSSTAGRVLTHPTIPRGRMSTEEVNTVADTTESSVKLRREDEQPAALGHVYAWTGVILLALLLLSVTVNVVLAHRLVRRKPSAFVGQNKQDYYYHQSNQDNRASEELGSVKQSHVLDGDRTTLEQRGLGAPNAEHHSLSVLVRIQDALRRCRGKSSSSYSLQWRCVSLRRSTSDEAKCSAGAAPAAVAYL